MTRKTSLAIFSLTIVGALLAFGLVFSTPAQAGAIPTPVSPPVGHATANSSVYTVFSGQVITADTRSSALTISGYSVLDVQITVDVTDPVTTTIKLQHSNDGINWANGQTILATTFSTVDDSTIVQLPNFARFTAVYVDVAASTNQTYTVSLLAK